MHRAEVTSPGSRWAWLASMARDIARPRLWARPCQHLGGLASGRTWIRGAASVGLRAWQAVSCCKSWPGQIWDLGLHLLLRHGPGCWSGWTLSAQRSGASPAHGCSLVRPCCGFRRSAREAVSRASAGISTRENLGNLAKLWISPMQQAFDDCSETSLVSAGKLLHPRVIFSTT